MLPENDTWRGNQECESNVPLVEALQAEQTDVNNLKGVRHIQYEVTEW